MTYTVRVAQSDIAFDCAPDQTILAAARAAGYELPYSCRNGVCGSCKGSVNSGSVDLPESLAGITQQERAAGCTLFCLARPTSDVEIGARSITTV